MAKNLLDKIISFAGETFSGTRDYSDTSVYRTDASGLTGVAKYLNKINKVDETALTGVARYLQNKQEVAVANEVIEPEAVAEVAEPMSRVDKYLARKGRAVAATSKAEQAPASGVAKYLKGESAHPATKPVKEKPATPIVPEVKKILSKVEKYLAKQAEGIKTAEMPKVPEVKKILSKVEKYLAKHNVAEEKPKSKVEKYLEAHDAPPAKPKSRVEKYLAAHEKQPAKPKSRVEKYLADHDSKPAKPQSRVEKYLAKKPAAPSGKAKAASGAAEKSRCQASTAKGTQCNRTANLSKIQRTIDKKKYKFLACSQHKTDAFKPHPSFID